MRTSKRISIGRFLELVHEAGSTSSVAAVCRREGIPEATFRRWRQRLAAELETDRHLLDENRRLKAHVDTLTVEKALLQRIIRRGT